MTRRLFAIALALIAEAGGRLVLTWDRVMASVPFTVRRAGSLPRTITMSME